MLIQYALSSGALAGATSDWLDELRREYAAAAELRTAVTAQDERAAAAQLRRLLLPSGPVSNPVAAIGSSRALLSTLQRAVQSLLNDLEVANAGAAPVSAAGEDQSPAQDAHESAAAEALTGLRRLPSASRSVPARPTSPPVAAFGGLTSPLSITAPPPPPFGPSALFPPFTPSPATPSSLPSLFARRVLAPLPSPVPSAVPVPSAAPSAVAVVAPELSPTSLTPVFYRPFAGAAGAAGGPPPPADGSKQSPVHQKRKSLPTKQLAVSVPSSAPASAGTAAGTAGTAGDPPPTPTTPAAAFALPNGRTFEVLDRGAAARKAAPRRWTREEDEALRSAVESHREKNWKAIAALVPGRNHTQCLQRWTKVLAPGLVKGHWSPHEDELLRRLVAAEQKNWGEVAAQIPGRTSKQCRERWHNHLDPNIVRGAYSPEEDRIILEAQARLGNRWSVIAAMLPGRTEDAVKIRWKSHCRVWRARKYLRKAPTGHAGEVADDDGRGPSDDEWSEPPTPQTPLVGPGFAWPMALPSPTATAAPAAD